MTLAWLAYIDSRKILEPSSCTTMQVLGLIMFPRLHILTHKNVVSQVSYATAGFKQPGVEFYPFIVQEPSQSIDSLQRQRLV